MCPYVVLWGYITEYISHRKRSVTCCHQGRKWKHLFLWEPRPLMMQAKHTNHISRHAGTYTHTHAVLYHRSDTPYKQLEFQPRMYMWTITLCVCVCLCVVLYKRETERDREQVSARSQTRWLNVSEYHTNMTACSPNRISTHCNTASPINSVSRRGWGFFCTGWDIKHFSSFSGL